MPIRYWFKAKRGLGFGVTAQSREDAESLLRTLWPASSEAEIVEIISDIDLTSLDQAHVLPNIGLPNVRGVWFPCLNV
jgi:hypothetical protein